MAVPSHKKVFLFDRAYALWEAFHNDYDKLVTEYEVLLQQKRDLGIKPLDPIRKARLKKEAPNIELFTLQYESEVEKYLSSLTVTDLMWVILEIEKYLESPIRITLIGRIWDFKHQIKVYDIPKSAYAMDPDACGCGRKSSRPMYGLNLEV